MHIPYCFWTSDLSKYTNRQIDGFDYGKSVGRLSIAQNAFGVQCPLGELNQILGRTNHGE